jgi:hypothetical protein
LESTAILATTTLSFVIVMEDLKVDVRVEETKTTIMEE